MPSESKKKKSEGQRLKEKLTWEFPQAALESPEIVEKALDFCEDYKYFLSEAKIEREAVAFAAERLKEAGYREFDPAAVYKAGDQVYFCNRGKSIIATTFGKKPLSEGLRLNAAHIDSPRLDLKPSPLYEKESIAYFKTHYYGGIKKYQWVTIPLALHGVIFRKDGTKVTVRYGEDPGEPVLYISDLLPHLAAKQQTRKLSEGIRGEELNILLGTLPFPEKDLKDAVKLNVLSILNEKYGITEADFLRAELTVVAAGPARDAGFDRSMIASPGHDDRVCAYTALRAEIDTKKPEYTTVTVLTDKEEIGSVGNTSLHSDYLKHYLEYLAENQKVSYKDMVRSSMCLSSDVSVAYDPTFADVFEPGNACYMGKGAVVMKYTGARGKSGASDASAETMYKLIDILNKNHVYWQSGELGKVDEGGGGTVAQFVAGLNIDVVDIGVPVLSMHAPVEIVSKIDVYETYKAYMAFYK